MIYVAFRAVTVNQISLCLLVHKYLNEINVETLILTTEIEYSLTGSDGIQYIRGKD